MKKLLIIGASSGIGFATAQQALVNGYHVISASRNTPSMTGVEHHHIDITSEEIDWSFIPDTLHGLVYAPELLILSHFIGLN